MSFDEMFREVDGDLWDQLGKVDAIVFPTSAYIDPKGKAKLGRGLGAQVCELIPNAESILGEMMYQNGKTNIHSIGVIDGTKIIAFPIRPENIFVNATKINLHPNVRKRYQVGDVVPGYYGVPDSGLFAHSANLLYDLIMNLSLRLVAIPKMGSSVLDWYSQILPVLSMTKLAYSEHIIVVTGEEAVTDDCNEDDNEDTTFDKKNDSLSFCDGKCEDCETPTTILNSLFAPPKNNDVLFNILDSILSNKPKTTNGDSCTDDSDIGDMIRKAFPNR